MSVSGVNGGATASRPIVLLSADASQQLQDLTGMSEDAVEKLVEKYAEDNGLRIDQAANELIDQLQNPGESGNAVDGAPALTDDADGNGIPDMIEDMLASGLITAEDAANILKSLGVPVADIRVFFEQNGYDTDSLDGGADY